MTIEFASPFFTPPAASCASVRFHWPMQGPHALASTVAPAVSKTLVKPSRAMVARTVSEPGVTLYGILNLRPALAACCTSEAERAMSS